VDRKRMVVWANLARAGVLLVLVGTIVSGIVSIAIVLAALFVLRTAETSADSASSPLVPGLVSKNDLGIANARMQGGFLLMNQLVGPPLGAFMFAIGAGLPFAANAICFVAAAILVSRVVISMPVRTGERTSLRADLVEGGRWALPHPPMRTLAVALFLLHVTFGAAWGVLVLYAGERLGLCPVGFGLLTTAVAIRGVIRAAVAGARRARGV